MAGKETSTRQPPSRPDKLPELAQLVMENEKLRRKHRKVQHRRDHYARLYYRCQADLDEKKWELHFARIKIRELKAQIAGSSLNHTLSQEHPPLSSSSRSDILPHLSMRAHPHYLTHSHPHSYNNHYQHSQQQHQTTPSKIGVPSSILPHPGHIPRHESDSDSTSPDSGASFSPGMGTGSGVDPLLSSDPTSSFPHSHSQEPLQPARARSKTLPHSMQFPQDKSTGSKSHANSFASDSEMEGKRLDQKKLGRGAARELRKDHGAVERRAGEEDWVAWVKGRNMPARYKVGVSAPPTHPQPQEGWREERREKADVAPQENVSTNQTSGDSTAARSPINFKNSAPPSSTIASPLATHRRHPLFEQKLPLSYGSSLSQGNSLPHSPLSPPLPHAQNRKKIGHPHVHFSLSQEAYISSPLYIRKPAFKGAVASSAHKMRSQVVPEVVEARGEWQSPIPRVTPTQEDSEQFSDSEKDPQSQAQSAFCKPQFYRQMSQPTHLVSSTQYPPSQKPDPRLVELHLSPPPSNPPTNHVPPHSPHLRSPPSLSTHVHTSHPPPPSHTQSHFHPPPPPSSLPPSLPTSHTRTQTHFDLVDGTGSVSSHPQHSQSPGSPVGVGVFNHQRGVANSDMGVSLATSASLTEQGRNHRMTTEGTENLRQEEDEEDVTEDEEQEEEGGEGDGENCYEGLTAVQMLDLLSKIGDPKCTITKLEIVDSNLGQPQAMAVLCRDLCRNKSLRELSLPNNGIGAESLQILLECIQRCTNIRELKLRGNDIGKGCAPLIKALMEQTSLNSLVLTGNEIEQYGDLLHSALPSDFTMEYDTAEGSVDSGVVVADTEQYNNGHTSLKYLHV